MWVAFFFPLLMISLPQEINVLKKTKNKVFATLSFQGLCSTLTFRESFLPSNFRENSQKKKKHLSAGLQMFLLLLQGPRAQLLHLIGETDGRKQRNRREIKAKGQQNSYKKLTRCFLKKRVWVKAILHQQGVLSITWDPAESSVGEMMGYNKPSLRPEMMAALYPETQNKCSMWNGGCWKQRAFEPSVFGEFPLVSLPGQFWWHQGVTLSSTVH